MNAKIKTNVIKRNGEEVAFDLEKIINAIKGANKDVDKLHRMNEYQIMAVADNVAKKIEESTHAVNVEDIQDMVETGIMELRGYEVAQKYVRYRYKRELMRKTNTTDNGILALLEHMNEEVNQENSNKNPVINSTQRDYMAGEVSKDLSRRVLLPEEVVRAHEAGIIHFHDSDYFAQKEHNCDLINLQDMLQNGTVISETMIEKPHSFFTACNVTTQIVAQVASNQYGGQSFTLAHLAPFVDISRKKIRRNVIAEREECGEALDETIINKVTERRLREEVKSGIQTIQYQLITLMTCNGQAPFVTMFMYLDEVEEGRTRDDLAMIIEDIERTRLTNIKVMFFAGVNDGIVPKAAGRGGIISQYEREALKELDIELAPGAREQAFIQRFYLYLNMTKPSRELYISYTRLDSEKKAAQPSYLIGILKGMFPELVVTETEDVEQLLDISSRQSALDYLLSNEVDDRWCEIAAAVMLYDASVSDAGDGNEVDDKEFTQKNSVERLINARFEHYSKDPISRNVARSIYGRHMEGSITRFEQFARCAYAHFLNYGLRLTEREESGFTSLDMGNIYHEALERYSKKLDRESTDWFSVTDAKRDELAMEAINEVIDEYAGFGIFDTAESQHSISHMKAVFKQTVWALTTQIRRGSFVPERFEFSFYESLDMANDVTVDIKGRVDRTDTYTDEGRLFVKVLDYKSGNTVFDLVKLYYGTQLQLAVYMDAVMEQKKEALKQVSVEPGGMLYYHIDDPVIDLKDVTPGTELSEEEINQMILKKLKPDGLINSDEKAYRGMDRDFEKSSDVIPVTLKKDQTPAAGSKVANAEEFDVITRFAREKLREIGREIYDGNVDVNPIKNKKIDSCAYCAFQAICRYDSRIPGFSERSFNGDNKEDVLDKMRTQIAAAEHKACYGDNNIKP